MLVGDLLDVFVLKHVGDNSEHVVALIYHIGGDLVVDALDSLVRHHYLAVLCSFFICQVETVLLHLVSEDAIKGQLIFFGPTCLRLGLSHREVPARRLHAPHCGATLGCRELAPRLHLGHDFGLGELL